MRADYELAVQELRRLEEAIDREQKVNPVSGQLLARLAELARLLFDVPLISDALTAVLHERATARAELLRRLSIAASNALSARFSNLRYQWSLMKQVSAEDAARFSQ